MKGHPIPKNIRKILMCDTNTLLHKLQNEITNT